MAIYHFSSKIISRSSRNTVRALAYRTGCKVYDHRIGQLMSTRKEMHEVQHVELLLPQDAPEWASKLKELISVDRQKGIRQFSDIVESSEKRRDAQIYRELEFALPQELSDDQNISLAREYLEDQCCKLGISVLANFHFDIDEETGERKPHCHALLLTRRLANEGFSLKKERRWNQKSQHETWREQWAAYVNFHLKMHGIDQLIDHRSNAERGIEIEPQPKRGTNIKDMEFRVGNNPKDLFSAATSEKAVAFRETKLRNTFRLIRKPEIILDIVSKHQSTFMWNDVEKVLNRYIDDHDLYIKLENKVKSSSELVLLRMDMINQQDGSMVDQPIYTTRKMLEAEVSLVHRAEKLSQAQSHKVKSRTIETVIAQFDQKLKDHGGLSEDQKRALQHITSSSQLSCIVGYAGAGKTTALEAAREMWEVEGYKVYGLAPTGRASQNLEQSGISSQTLHKFLKSYEEGRCRYSSKSVLILDEAGMVDTQRFESFLKAVDALGGKAVVVGDGAQLQPVEAGSAFRFVTEKVGFSRLETIIRQQAIWQKEATMLFGTLKTREALQKYQDKGYVRFIDEHAPSMARLKEQGNQQEIVKTYNLSRRMVGNIYHSMIEDLKDENYSDKNLNKMIKFHQDYRYYKDWREIKSSSAEHIIQNLEPCRTFMKEFGVDPLKFAAQFVDKHQSIKEQKQEAVTLARKWNLPQLDSHQKQNVCDLRSETKKALIQEWYISIKEDPQKSHLMMTYSKIDTAKLNKEARILMKQDGIIAKKEFLYTVHKQDEDDFGGNIVTKEEKNFSKGDRILFLKNDNGLGVKNGSLGTILEIDKSKIRVKIDKIDKVVSFAPKLYPYFDQGWAINIHKSQGTTVDRAFLLATHETYRNLAYVGMTRHRESVKVFCSKFDFWKEDIFFKRLSSSQEKLSSLDYVKAYDSINLPKKNSNLQKILNRFGNELEAIQYVSKQAWQSIAERFLGNSPEQQEIRILQESARE